MGELTRTPAPQQATAPEHGARPSAERDASRPPRSTVPVWSMLTTYTVDHVEAQADAAAARVAGGHVHRRPGDPIAPDPPTTARRLPDGGPAELNGLAAGGRPLDAETRRWFEPRFGVTLDHVRVHDDAAAHRLADRHDARAFAYGNHLVFGRGELDTSSADGRRVMAHELAHVALGHTLAPAVWRQPKSGGDDAGPQRLEVPAIGMDAAAIDLSKRFAPRIEGNIVFIGLHPKFVKVYNTQGRSIGGRIPIKDGLKVQFHRGVYVEGKGGGLDALTITSDPNRFGLETGTGSSSFGQRPWTKQELAERKKEIDLAEKEGREPKLPEGTKMSITSLVVDASLLESKANQVPSPRVAIYFVPTYTSTGGTGKGTGTPTIYHSPIAGRGDGKPPNAPPWPVKVTGPQLVPVDSTPTFSANVEWSANGNYSLASQVISQVGETIHYRWELFDITTYAKQELAKQAAAKKRADKDAPPPETPTLDQKIEELTASKAGTGTDVTGMGAANRNFRREFEDWWIDTKRSKERLDKGVGDTASERLSNATANRLSLELAPVSLVVTAIGAALRWAAELFAGPRQQQEVRAKTKGIYLVRAITTPAVNTDTKGEEVIRPPSVDARVFEATAMETAVEEALDEPHAKLAELKAQIDLATDAGELAKAEYLTELYQQAQLQFFGSPLDVLRAQKAKKEQELKDFQAQYPSLSDYSRRRAVDQIEAQIKAAERHETERLAGSVGTLGPSKRINASLVSEVSGQVYPLLLTGGPMADADDGRRRWMISDVTNPDGDAYVGYGTTDLDAFASALEKFGNAAAYGRGKIGAETAGLGLTGDPKKTIYATSAPTDWYLAEKRLDDLVATLAALGLIVTSAGTAAALVGAGVAAARLIERWEKGRLRFDAQTIGDALSLLGGIGAAGQLAGGLRVARMEKMFVIAKEGQLGADELAAAAKALKGAQNVFKAVEMANEALNYAGLLWGNVTFIDEMMAIAEDERNGSITHAEARRRRASAVSSAVQNNGFFVAGNIAKAKAKQKELAKAAAEPAAAPHEPAPVEEGPHPSSTREPTPGDPTEPLPKKRPPTDADETRPAGTAEPAAPVPLSERRATLAELQAQLPADMRGKLQIDPSLTGDTVMVDYAVDPKSGLITDVWMRCSPDARPGRVGLHAETFRTMQKYQGFRGRVGQAIAWVTELFGVKAIRPEDGPSFRAAAEIQKLPDIIEDQMRRVRDSHGESRTRAEAELDSLRDQLAEHLVVLGMGGDGDLGGSVAAKGMTKAQQRRYAEMQQRLRKLDAGSADHKQLRWEMYQLRGGDLPYATWSKVYESNMQQANRANKIVAAEHQRLGWGTPEQTIDPGTPYERRLDIADQGAKKGVEVKAYASGRVYASEDLVSEADRDGRLVRRGWKITWLFIDCDPSGPLLQKLHKANITVEIRHRTGVPAEVVRLLPPPAT